MARHLLQPLLAPTSVVVLTGSNPRHPVLLALLRALEQGAKLERISLVGMPVVGLDSPSVFDHFSSLAELEAPADLAIIAGEFNIPITQVIADCGQAGIKFLLMLTWTDEPVANIQVALQEFNVRLLGPNSFGICRPGSHLFAWLGLAQPRPGRLALLSQSGTVASALVDWASWQGIGFSQVVAMGEPVDDIMPSQLLDFLTGDFETQSILLYLQHVGHPTRFLSSLRAASRTKPVAVVAEHGLGADERVLDAALNRTGAVRGRRLNDLVAAASVMTNARRIRDGALLIVGNGAGPSELAAQRASELNVSLLDPSQALRDQLAVVMAGRGSIGPVTTVWASCPTDLFIELAATALVDKDCGAVLLMLSPTALVDMGSLYENILQLHQRQNKLVMVCLLGGGPQVAVRTRINEAGIPTFRTPETAIEGFQFLVQFQRNQQLAKQLPDSNAVRDQIDVVAAQERVKQLLRAGKTQIGWADVAAVLAPFNISVNQETPSVTSGLKGPIQLRVFQDKVFGPAIGVSVGGEGPWQPQMEVVGLPPLNRVLAKDIVEQVFAGRGSSTLEELLLNVSTMVCELPEVQSFSLTNVYLKTDGSICGEVSATLAITNAQPRYEHLAIQPYPRQWVSRFQLRDGREATVRPLRPEDAPMLADFVRGLSRESRYFRFISNFSELTPQLLARFCHIDYDREMELIALVNSEGHNMQVGAARYNDNYDGNSCEFAVVLSDDYQGHGLATYLMKQLFLVAADKGLQYMRGTVLAENRHMIGFCRKLGFQLRRDPEDSSMMMAELELSPEFIKSIKG